MPRSSAAKERAMKNPDVLTRVVRPLVFVAGAMVCHWTACGCLAGSAGATFTPLGFLPGGNASSARAVSDDGSVIAGSAHDGSKTVAVRWVNGVIEPLGVLATHPSASGATAMSDDGSIIVGFSGVFPSMQAFRWSAGTMEPLGFLPGHTLASSANCISADGSVIAGWAYSGTAFLGLRIVGGVNSPLADLPGSLEDSAASGISADGSVIAGRGISPGFSYEACRWENGGAAIAMGDLSGGITWSELDDVSANGAVFVGYANSGTQSGGLFGEAARWVGGGAPESLGDLPGGRFNGYAFGVSGDGAVIVGYSHTAIGPEAFIWDEANGMRNLREVLVNEHGIDMTGWVLINAIEVSTNGARIVGVGTNPSGQTEAWAVEFGCVEAGDVDDDGDVDFADLNVLLNQWQTAGPEADLNGSGNVDFGDLNLLLSRWGQAC